MLSVYDEQSGADERADVSRSEFVAGLLRAQCLVPSDGSNSK
jgi:hypothetical protein